MARQEARETLNLVRAIGVGVWGEKETVEKFMGDLEQRAGLVVPATKKQRRLKAINRIAGIVTARGGKVNRG